MAKSKRAQIVAGEKDRARLERIRTDPHSIPEHVPGATIVLRLGDGPSLSRTTLATGMSKPTIRRWGGTASSRRASVARIATSPGEGAARTPPISEKLLRKGTGWRLVG